jgi:FimV-like protein
MEKVSDHSLNGNSHAGSYLKISDLFLTKIACWFLFIFLMCLSGQAFSAYPFYGPTFINEHLYRIALRVRPNPSITVQQMMIALLKANPDAFAQHNINALKAGYWLQLPPLELIIEISPEMAARLVSQQNRMWERGNIKYKTIATLKITKMKNQKKAEKNPEKEWVDTIPSIEGAQEVSSTEATRSATSTSIADLGKRKTTLLDVANTQNQAVGQGVDHQPPSNKIDHQQTPSNKVAADHQQASSNKVDHQQTPPSNKVEAQQATSNNKIEAQQTTSNNKVEHQQTANKAIEQAGTIKAIDNKLNIVIETNKAAITQTQSRLTTLTRQTKTLETKVNQLATQLEGVTKQVTQLVGKNLEAATGTGETTPSYNRLLFNNLKNSSWGLSVGILTLILLTYFLFRSFKPVSRAKNSITEKDEYDYMGSQESISTKLDLARTYVDMGDNRAAKKVLKEVLQNGDEAQCRHAHDLLKKIN